MRIRKTLLGSILTAIVTIGLFGFHVNLANAENRCGQLTIVPLITKMGFNRGNVEVYNDSSTLYVKYIAGEGLVLSEISLAVGTSLTDIPQKNSKPLLKLFPHQIKLSNPRNDYTYTFDFAEEGFSSDTALYVAAYALVGVLKAPGKVAKKEKVWADGIRFTYKKEPTYFSYAIQECVSCEILNPSKEQIEAAVMAALEGIDDPWGNVHDFQLLLDQAEANMGCTIDMSDEAASQNLPETLPQSEQTCAEEGVSYCGVGNSDQGGNVFPAWYVGARLNNACCEHDNCYGVKCIDRDCYWRSQARECDNGLMDACKWWGLIDFRSQFFCVIVSSLVTKGLLNQPQKCKEAASCVEGPQPDCKGSTCGNFTTCNPGSGCEAPVCGTIAEGGGLCVEGMTQCSDLTDCNTTADCGGQGLCIVDSCCIWPVCVPSSAFCPDIGLEPLSQEDALEFEFEGLTLGGQ